ncbi:MAG: sigma-70 family RNA polymerase sigma factor [Rubripirellula sp.]
MNRTDGPNQESTSDRETSYGEFVSLIARHDLSIRRFIRSLLPTIEGVDDVMQDTALECWRKYSDFSPGEPQNASDEFVRWACVIARYKVLSWQRDRSRDRLVFRESVVSQLADSALENLDRRDAERHAMEGCLKRMDDDQRRLVLSVHLPGESIARIAAETGQKARRLYSRLNALRKLLLNCVEQRIAEDA